MNGEPAHGSIGRIGFHSNKAHLAVVRTLFEKFLFENSVPNEERMTKQDTLHPISDLSLYPKKIYRRNMAGQRTD